MVDYPTGSRAISRMRDLANSPYQDPYTQEGDLELRIALDSVREGIRLDKPQLAILTLLLQHGEMYGLEMIEASGGALSRGTVYVWLSHLCDRGYVTHRDAEQDVERGPKKRKKYSITPKYRVFLRMCVYMGELLEEVENEGKGVNELLAGVTTDTRQLDQKLVEAIQMAPREGLTEEGNHATVLPLRLASDALRDRLIGSGEWEPDSSVIRIQVGIGGQYHYFHPTSGAFLDKA